MFCLYTALFFVMNKPRFTSSFSSQLLFLSKPGTFKIILMFKDQPVYAALSGTLWKWAQGKKFRSKIFLLEYHLCVWKGF
jgi:hypothetical protein